MLVKMNVEVLYMQGASASCQAPSFVLTSLLSPGSAGEG